MFQIYANLNKIPLFLKDDLINLAIFAVLLTWAFLDTECSVGILCIEVMLQLKSGWIVDKGLGTLSNTCSTVIEIHAGLKYRKKMLSFPNKFLNT